MLAVTSHVPHLIAYNIVGTVNDLERVTEKEVIKFSASGFRDFTRIAASDPTMWRDIFMNNKEAVLEILGRFTEDLASLAKGHPLGRWRHAVFNCSRGRARSGAASSMRARIRRPRLRPQDPARETAAKADSIDEDFQSRPFTPSSPFEKICRGLLGFRLWLADVAAEFQLRGGVARAARRRAPGALPLFGCASGRPSAPGLVLGLDKGSHCEGMAFRVPPSS